MAMIGQRRRADVLDYDPTDAISALEREDDPLGVRTVGLVRLLPSLEGINLTRKQRVFIRNPQLYSRGEANTILRGILSKVYSSQNKLPRNYWKTVSPGLRVATKYNLQQKRLKYISDILAQESLVKYLKNTAFVKPRTSRGGRAKLSDIDSIFNAPGVPWYADIRNIKLTARKDPLRTQRRNSSNANYLSYMARKMVDAANEYTTQYPELTARLSHGFY